jgi:DNA polymerase III delta subunit
LLELSDNITAKEVQELSLPVTTENVFALSDAVVAQNKKAALEVLENLMHEENTTKNRWQLNSWDL